VGTSRLQLLQLLPHLIVSLQLKVLGVEAVKEGIKVGKEGQDKI